MTTIRTKNIIKVHKRRADIGSALIYISLIFILFYRHFVEKGITENTKYVLDAITITAFLVSITKMRFTNLFKLLTLIYAYIIVIGTVSRVTNITVWNSDIVHFMMDIRMLARYPMYTFACVSLLNDNDCRIIKKTLYIFNVINTLLIIYQYNTINVLDYWMRGDYLNGFFGAYRGGNVHENVLLVIVTIIAIDDYVAKKINTPLMLINLVVNLLVATITELKYYYIEFFVILLVYFASYLKRVTTKKIFRSLTVALIFIVGAAYFITVLYKLYPWMQGTLTSWTRILDYFSNSHGDSREMINRTSFISDVFNTIFHGDVIKLIFGVGLGTANTGTYGGMLPEFAQNYGYTAYSWYLSSYILVETGIIGLILYCMAFLLPMDRRFTRDRSKRKMVICTCIMSIMMIFYNETFRTEAGLMMCLLLAISNIKDANSASETQLFVR